MTAARHAAENFWRARPAGDRLAWHYSPSAIDATNAVIERLPIATWVFHGVVAVVLIVVQLLALAVSQRPPNATLAAVLIFNGVFPPFLMGAMGLLDRQAAAALASMRPALTASSDELAAYEYRLTNMPPLMPLAVGTAALVAVVVMEKAEVARVAYYGSLIDWSPFTVMFHVIDKASAFLFAVFIYHTIRQLRLVAAIHSEDPLVDLFDLDPLRAFSTLTASTAVSLVVGVYAWLLINPDVHTNPVVVGFAVAVTSVATVAFALPLYSVHRTMEAAKTEKLRHIRRRLGAAIANFDGQYDHSDGLTLAPLNLTIAALATQEQAVARIRTWPWRPEAAQSALTAIGVPLMLSLVGALIP